MTVPIHRPVSVSNDGLVFTLHSVKFGRELNGLLPSLYFFECVLSTGNIFVRPTTWLVDWHVCCV